MVTLLEPTTRNKTILRPMLATLRQTLPDTQDYAFEVKWDGYRILADVSAKTFRLWSRNQVDLTHRYPQLRGLQQAIGDNSVLLDGEVVALDEEGVPRFHLLQNSLRSSALNLQFVIFDLLELNRVNVCECPYILRRDMLAELKLNGSNWQTPEYFTGDYKPMFELIAARGMEGLIAKRLDSPYLPGARSDAWIKLKVRRRQELVIGGWEPGEGSRKNLPGSLLLGYYDALPDAAAHWGRPQQFVYAGECGSGLNALSLAELKRLLEARETAVSPFEINAPKTRGVRFVRPELVGEFEFAEWTPGNVLRQAVFLGLRHDRCPNEVIREEA